MPWLRTKTHRYYRRKVLHDNRVSYVYVGRGPAADVIAAADRLLRDGRKAEGERERAGRDRFARDMRAVAAVDDLLADVFGVVAHEAGLHIHHRGWRRGRGFDMAKLRGLRALNAQLAELIARDKARAADPPPPGPLVAPDLSDIPPADREALARAAEGDAAALAAARPYLEQPRYVDRWGSPADHARRWLVYQAAGDDRLVAAAVRRKADAIADELGWAGAGVLERLAITRVVNNHLAVYVLEARAGGYDVASRGRAAVERCLTLAERRYLASVRTLAVLRRTDAGAVLRRVAVIEAAGPGTPAGELQPSNTTPGGGGELPSAT